MNSDGTTLAAPRQELQLLAAAPQADGTPAWTLHDPVRNRYFRIGWREFELLGRWSLGVAEAVVEAVNRETTLAVEIEHVQALERFLAINQLLSPADAPNRQYLRFLIGRESATGLLTWKRLLHGYLFFRVPLLRPDRFLTATLPGVIFLQSWLFRVLTVVVALLGGYLALRQWDGFVHHASRLFTLEGLLWFVVAGLLSKLAHELGHAYALKRQGLPVPVMGVAFLLMWPVFYTDATAAWRLVQRRPRLGIAAAGLVAELTLGAWALLLWGFLPDGALRSACFFLASAGWTLSLVLNLNPFMRFDGYHLLADFLNIANLQDRAFALGRWQLRRTLLGWKRPCPEFFSQRRTLFLIIYAYATWIYRLFLFTAIAVMVYQFFFKLLGLILFAVEIGWLLVRPVFRELLFMYSQRATFGWNPRLLITLGMLAGLVICAILPLPRQIGAPAILRAAQQSQIFAPFPARLERIMVRTGQRLHQGDPLFQLANPGLIDQQQQSQARLAILEALLKRRAGDEDLLAQGAILQERLARVHTTLAGIRAQRQRLHIVAPMDGVVVEMAEGLKPGVWLQNSLPLVRLINPEQTVAEAYPTESAWMELDLKKGLKIRFYPENPEFPPRDGYLNNLDGTAVHILENPYLASQYGGDILVKTDARGKWISREARYRLTLIFPGKAPGQVLRGVVRIPGKPIRFLSRVRQQIEAVLIRESGF